MKTGIIIGIVLFLVSIVSVAAVSNLDSFPEKWFLFNTEEQILELVTFAPTGEVLKGIQLPEQPSPHDWVKENQIEVHKDKIIIYIDEPIWATFTDTNSMDPVFDHGSHAIEIVPESIDDIHIGDIVSYNKGKGPIIHRVVDISEDEQGWYAVMKGDNAPVNDPEKVRFFEIERILVMIIY